jgi:hypothetical protein
MATKNPNFVNKPTNVLNMFFTWHACETVEEKKNKLLRKKNVKCKVWIV